MLNIGISSYNVRAHVPSDVASHNQIISSSNLKSQYQLEKINEWTNQKKMKLNIKKNKNMTFNFSRKYQFNTRLNVMNTNIDMVNETTLLGTVITDQLCWDRNTEELCKKGYKRMQLLNAVASFTSNTNDLKDIYITFVRSVLEQSAAVWHSSLTMKNINEIRPKVR